jgi:hypothetical protein
MSRCSSQRRRRNGLLTNIIDATMLTGTAASPLASIAAQHPAATITELPGPSNVAREAHVHGG